MIFASSSCVKSKKISETIELFAQNGILNIELSGGTNHYDGLENDLHFLKDKYGLNYLLHNYFPPPKEHFVLNLASLDDEIFSKSLNSYKDAISLAIRLESPCYALHAGFYTNPDARDLGKKFIKSTLFNKTLAQERFIESFKTLQEFSKGQIELHIENNVVSLENYKTFCENPFMLTTYEEYEQLKKRLNFNLLLDVGHLKVSASTLGLDFKDEFEKLFCISNYIHLSENDGMTDLNLMPERGGEVYNLLKQKSLCGKIATIEVSDEILRISDLYCELNKWN